jgi:hypothetical protein
VDLLRKLVSVMDTGSIPLVIATLRFASRWVRFGRAMQHFEAERHISIQTILSFLIIVMIAAFKIYLAKRSEIWDLRNIVALS